MKTLVRLIGCIFIIGVGLFLCFESVGGVRLPPGFISMGLTTGILFMIVSFRIPGRKKEKVVYAYADLPRIDAPGYSEEETGECVSEETMDRQERERIHAAVKEHILARIKPLGFREVGGSTVWLEEGYQIPIRARVCEVIPLVREIADGENIDIRYQFCGYDSDIPTINITLFFLDSDLTVGPEIPL